MAAYQSLYRRYRPQRFDEVLGQDHVTKALRNAVREGRVGHAYLFSGPRGTGKTSTARILAKVLNCDAPVDGEPCGKCENCVAVAEGRITDWLLEQDAASKSKVDDMRDLIERVPLGTSGKRRVIILDEVHMLSQGAENALLKTLEEPPEHVVFVLATTDPQKVRPTIRSRTQHFEFRLLSPDVLAEHVRHVIADAGLDLDVEAIDQAVDQVIRSGAGSARDTLSALDQVAALGEVFDESQPVDAVMDALCDRDAGAVLVAMADALAAGRDPRTLGEDLIAALRDAFLAVMGVADEHVAPAQRERAADVGRRLGPAGLTRALDVLGESLIELARKPDPRIVVEVALVRLTQPSTDRTLDAVLERLDRLERRGDASGGGSGGTSGGGPDEVDPPGGAASARAALSNRRTGDATASSEPPPTPTHDKPTLGAVVRQQEEPPRAVEAAAGPIPDLAEIATAWTDVVLTGLPKSVRSRWRGGRWIEPDPGTVRFAVPNKWHQKECEESRRDVEEALRTHFGGPVPVAIVVEGEPAGASPAVGGAALADEMDHVDPTELRDADDAAATGVDLVVRTFGGGELIQED
ncbi:MAG TPA: DNA polymerase III subunit gamma/tau [Acidimicrobiales bacterium]|nr:DNA polymerase III subunit gamma/tau [Acidimicrobiales bacterium]